jgi:hypothetical protein
MASIDEIERGYLVADQIVADITKKVGTLKPGERINWPHPSFKSSIPFREVTQWHGSISALLEPNLAYSQGQAESETIKALKQILGSSAAELDLNPAQLRSNSGLGELEDGSVVDVAGNSYYFRAPTTLRNSEGASMSYHLVIKDIGDGISIRQFLASPADMETARDAYRAALEVRKSREKKVEVSESDYPFVFVKGTGLTRIWAEYGRELNRGNRDSMAFVAKAGGKEALFTYTAALNALSLLRDRRIVSDDIRKLTFRKTGPGERDLVCDIKVKLNSDYPAEIVSIDVSKLSAEKYPIIAFPELAFKSEETAIS